MANLQKRVSADGTVRWTMRVFTHRDDRGKRHFITETFERKKDAEARARQLEGTKDTGAILVRPSKDTLLSYLHRWLDAKEGEIRARTIHDYRGIIRRYIETPPAGAPPIGSVPLNLLQPETFEALYAFLRKDAGLAPRTIQYLHTILRQALGDAVKKRTLPANPTDHAKRPTRAKEADSPADRTAVRAMSKVEAAAFLEASKSDRYHALWAVLLTGGLRPSEALALTWADVDLETGTLYVHQTLTRRGVEGWKIVETKTPRGRRNVTLPLVATQALKEWRIAQGKERLQLGGEYEDNGLVFATEFGKPLDDTNISSRNFRKIMGRAGLGVWEGEGKRRNFRASFRMYDLRHTCATLMLLAGVNPKVVSERLGHASITLTLDTYSHVLPSMQEEAAAKLEAMFGAAS